MKITFALCIAIATTMPLFLAAQDKEMEEQIKKANEAAKGLGVKTPDMQKLLEQTKIDEEEDQASEKASEISGTEKSPAATTSSSAAPKINVDLPSGTAKGSLTFDGVTSELKFASAFVDQKDDRKPVVLLLSDQKLPVEKWSSEFDMMRDHGKWSGVVFFLDKDGTAYRTDVHTKGQQASVSGYFDVKVNDPASKELSGMARSDSSGSDKKLDVTFHATRR